MMSAVAVHKMIVSIKTLRDWTNPCDMGWGTSAAAAHWHGAEPRLIGEQASPRTLAIAAATPPPTACSKPKADGESARARRDLPHV